MVLVLTASSALVDAASRGEWKRGLRSPHGRGRGRPAEPRRAAGPGRGRLRGRPSRCDHRGVGARPCRVPAGRRPDRGGRSGRSRGDAPALRHGPHGARAGWLARAERLLDGQGETPGARLVRGRPHLRADADGRPARRSAVGPARRRHRFDVRPGGVRHRTGGRSPAAHPRRRRRSRVWRCSTRPGWPPSPASSIRSRPGSSSASSCARCRASPSTTWPRSGPRRWSGGARRTPSGASTAAAGSTVPRSSGCAGRATRRRTRRSWPATSYAPTCGASSGGR